MGFVINTTAYNLGQSICSSPSTKEHHAWAYLRDQCSESSVKLVGYLSASWFHSCLFLCIWNFFLFSLEFGNWIFDLWNGIIVVNLCLPSTYFSIFEWNRNILCNNSLALGITQWTFLLDSGTNTIKLILLCHNSHKITVRFWNMIWGVRWIFKWTYLHWDLFILMVQISIRKYNFCFK